MEAAVIGAADRLNASERLNIVRLTKILGRGTAPLPDWFSAWESGRPVQPFPDHVIAPMSARFAGEAIATIGESRLHGKLHLSGARNITYVDLDLAARLGIAPALVEPTTSQSKG